MKNRMSIRSAKEFLKNKFPGLHRRWRARVEQEIRGMVQEILARTTAPLPNDSEEIFQRLQAQYSTRDYYRYDAFATWERGTERAIELLRNTNLKDPGARVLEIGAGDGMVGAALGTFGHKVTINDIENWLDARARCCEFVPADVCSHLPLDSDTFDLVYSYNTFQHLRDPARAFAEMVRVCAPGGWIYIHFGPLFAGPWGLHVYRILHMPYPQFLFSRDFITERLRREAVFSQYHVSNMVFDQGRVRATLLPLNEWRLRQFLELWKQQPCNLIKFETAADANHLNIIKDFPAAFSGRGLQLEDVTTSTLTVLFRKTTPC
jgi:SAM-dependent methyltransferase